MQDRNPREETGSQLPEGFSPELERAREAIASWNERAISFIREHPGASLLGALAAGFLVGRIVSRR